MDSRSPYVNASAPPIAPGAVPANSGGGRRRHVPTLYEIPKSYKDDRRTSAHCAFVLYGAFVALTALNLIIGQCWAFAVESLKPMEVLLRAYTIGLCLLVMLIEWDRFGLTRNSPILQNWISRGVFYTFLGVLGVVENDIGSDNEWTTYRERWSKFLQTNDVSITGEDCVEFYIFVVSWMLFGQGIVYALMGMCCLQRRYEWHREDHRRRRAETVLDADAECV